MIDVHNVCTVRMTDVGFGYSGEQDISPLWPDFSGSLGWEISAVPILYLAPHR